MTITFTISNSISISNTV